MEIAGDPPEDVSPRSASQRAGIALCALLTVGSLVWAADLYRAVGLYFMNEQFYAGMLAIGLPALFLCVPPRKGAPRSGVAWFDMIAAAVTCAAALYVMVTYPTILDNFADNPPDAVAAAAILLVGVAEGLRRTAGNVLLVFLLCFLGFALIGHLIPGRLQGQDVPLNRLAIYVTLDSNGMFGLPPSSSSVSCWSPRAAGASSPISRRRSWAGIGAGRRRSRSSRRACSARSPAALCRTWCPRASSPSR